MCPFADPRVHFKLKYFMMLNWVKALLTPKTRLSALEIFELPHAHAILPAFPEGDFFLQTLVIFLLANVYKTKHIIWFFSKEMMLSLTLSLLFGNHSPKLRSSCFLLSILELVDTSTCIYFFLVSITNIYCFVMLWALSLGDHSISR